MSLAIMTYVSDESCCIETDLNFGLTSIGTQCTTTTTTATTTAAAAAAAIY